MSEIEPAMTAEEWSEVRQKIEHDVRYAVMEMGPSPLGTRHALAAGLLHGQPFGFKRWMVEWMHTRSWDAVPEHIEAGLRFEHDVDMYIADRIASLLPPRETD